jgi:hypothetical protein
MPRGIKKTIHPKALYWEQVRQISSIKGVDREKAMKLHKESKQAGKLDLLLKGETAVNPQNGDMPVIQSTEVTLASPTDFINVASSLYETTKSEYDQTESRLNELGLRLKQLEAIKTLELPTA